MKYFLSLFLLLTLTACSSLPTFHSGRRGLFDGISGRSSEGRGRQVYAKDTHKDFDRTPSAEDSNPSLSKIKKSVSKWQWPLKHVSVTSHFGNRGGRFHEGIDLVAKVGTPVYAASGGKVLYSGTRISGYGKILIIKHSNTGLLSVYAHLSKAIVPKGQYVKKGQKIALSGATGKVSGPHLHFEVRKGVMAYDPYRVLNDPAHAFKLANK